MTTIKQRLAMALAVGCLGFATAAQGATTLLTFDGSLDPNPQPACAANVVGSAPATQICTTETQLLGNNYGSSAELAVRYARTVNVAGGTAVSNQLLFLYADGNGTGSSFGDIDNAASIFFTPTAGYEVSFDGFDFVSRNSATSAAFSLTDALGNTVFSFTSAVARSRTTYNASTAFFSGPLTLTFDGLGNTAPSVDNVRLTTRLIAATGAVPEPATWAMMLFGFGSMGYVMRRPNAKARIRFA